jgi:hypothetical protein
LRPGWSSGVFVLAEDAAEAFTSVDGQVRQPAGVGDRFGKRCEWPGIRDALMRPMRVVEDLELT